MTVGFRYTTDESMTTELGGMTTQDYHADLRTMVSAQDSANALIAAALDEDRRGRLSRGHVLDAEAMRCAVVWPEDKKPMVAAPVLDGQDAIDELRPSNRFSAQ